MLDGNNSGWILNAMHSREGCYTYVKEILKGESFVELAAKSSSCQMILFIYIFLKTLAGVPFLDFHKLNDSLCGSVNTKDGTVKADIITVCG